MSEEEKPASVELGMTTALTALVGELVEELVARGLVDPKSLRERFSFYEEHAREINPNGLLVSEYLLRAIELGEKGGTGG